MKTKIEKKQVAIVVSLLVVVLITVNLVGYYTTPVGFEDVKYGRFLFNTVVADGTIEKHNGCFIELTDGRIIRSSVFADIDTNLVGKTIDFFGDKMYGPHLSGVMFEGVPIEYVDRRGPFLEITTAKKVYNYALGPIFCIIDGISHKLPYTSRACYRE